MNIDRKKLIESLLRRQFGTLSPPPTLTLGSSVDRRLSEASYLRSLRIAGTDDPRPPIECARSQYETMPTEQLQRLADEASAEVRRKHKKSSEQAYAKRETRWSRWAEKDLWSEAEFGALCCGLIPAERGMPGDPGKVDGDESQPVAILRALDDIRRGTLSKNLSFVPRDDADISARMYGTARHYVPAIAAEWAAERFNTFPESLLVAVRQRALAVERQEPAIANEGALSTRERNNLLRIIRALDVMANLPDRGPSTSIVAQLHRLGFSSPGEDTIRKAVNDARGLEQD